MRRLLTLILVCTCAAAAGGCSDTSFVGKRVDNFTAYYNTFYNARESFEKGFDRVEERQASEQVDLNKYLSLFPEGESGTVTEFETTIEKSADVLREHPSSKWVDESLMLIGKSYYFQQNYIGAEQKFREVRGLGTKLESEARFWLVRTLVASGRLNEAERVSTAVLAEDDVEPDTWTARTWLARGSAFVQQGRWSDAAQALSTGLSGDLPRALRARSAFLLGQVRETLDDPSGAQSAYERAETAANEYELVYAARLSAIRVQGLNGAPDEALKRLESMESDDKNFERIGALRVLRARLLSARNQPGAARRVLRDVLYEEPPAQGATRGRAHYAMGSIYRDAYDDFSRAAAHFDTASTSLQQTITTREPVLLTPVAITNSQSLSRRYRILAERSADVARMDSLLDLGALPPDELRARLIEIREAQAERRAAEQERRAEQATARRFNNRTITTQRNRSRQTSAAATSGSFLFHDNPTRVQEGRRMFERRWGPRPRVDDWRRSAVIEQQQRQQASDPDARTDGDVDAPARAAATNTPEDLGETGLNVGDIPQTDEERRAMRSDRAVARYELATALFLNAERPDSAATWYRRIVDEDADQPVARRALYALAEVHTAEGRSEVARERYRQVIEEAPNSVFAQRARQRLGRAPIDVPDTTAIAEMDYAVAYRTWQSGRLDSARSAMARVAERHDSSAVAPKALLALATIGIDDLRRDSSRTPDSTLVRFLQVMPSSETMVEDGLGRLRDALGQDEPIDPESNAEATGRRGGAAPNQPGRPVQETTQRPSRRTDLQQRPRTQETPDSLRESAASIQQGSGARAPDRQEQPMEENDATERPLQTPKSVPRDSSDAPARPSALVPRRPGEARDNAEPVRSDTVETVASSEETERRERDSESDSGKRDDAEADMAAAVPDSVTRAYRPVVEVLAYLIARYPESSEAKRATTLGTEIAQRYALLRPEPDTNTAVTTDSLDNEPTQRNESAEREAANPDDGIQRPSRPQRPPRPQRAQPIREREQVDTTSTTAPADSARNQIRPEAASDGSRN